MVYFSIKIGSNCTLIHHYTFLDRHPHKLGLPPNNNIIYFNYIIIEVKNEGREGYGVCEKWCIGVMVYFLHLNC